MGNSVKPIVVGELFQEEVFLLDLIKPWPKI